MGFPPNKYNFSQDILTLLSNVNSRKKTTVMCAIILKCVQVKRTFNNQSLTKILLCRKVVSNIAKP